MTFFYQQKFQDFTCKFLHTKRLSFPQKKAVLLIAGGRKPTASFIKNIVQDKIIFAVDSGLEICKKAKIFPHIAFGDFDSVREETFKFFQKQKTPLRIYPTKKDLTDSQIALAYIHEHLKKHPLIITGAFGGRFDHFFSLFYAALKYKNFLLLLDDRECLLPLQKGEELHLFFSKMPKIISLLPLSTKVTGIFLDNVRYPLQNATLTKKIPYAISNEILAQKDQISIKIASGTLGVYLAFQDITPHK